MARQHFLRTDAPALSRAALSVLSPSHCKACPADSAFQRTRIMPKPIAIYYEQPHWFKPLFAELESARASRFEKDRCHHAHAYAIEDQPGCRSYCAGGKPHEPFGMEPRAWRHDLLHARLPRPPCEACGVRVINGSQAFRSELSKASQLSHAPRRSGSSTRRRASFIAPSQAAGRVQKVCAFRSWSSRTLAAPVQA